MNQLATPQQERPRNPIAQLRSDIKAALPTFGLKNEREQQRMASVLMVAVEKDPDLVFADRQSLIAATRQCANHGLVPDGNEATLQVYNTKVKVNGVDKWIKKVQYQPMIRGIVNRVLRSGKVVSFWADVVHEGESFKIDTSEGDRRPIHDPDHFNRSGEIVGAYAVAKMSNGSIDCEPMSLTEIEKVKAVAKTKKVWDGWFEEKSKVAVMRRLSKRLPLSSEDMDFILNREEHDLDQTPRDVTPDEPEAPRKTLAQKLKEGSKETEAPEGTGEPLSGEIMEPEGGLDVTKLNLSDAFPGSPEFDQGVRAFEQGHKLTDCPYETEEKAINWCGGYTQAEKAKS